jgi:hypothetical protein
MTQVAGTTFGIGSPTSYSPSAFSGSSPFAAQGLGFQPLTPQPYMQPFSGQTLAGYGINAGQPLQQILQLLQVVPQQLQQLQLLQQQQSHQLQWLLQILPAQLQQLHHLIQIVPQYLQQLQQQPFGTAGAGQLGFGLMPQVFGGQQTGHVM